VRRPWIDPAESAMASVIAVGSVHASSKARNETGTLAMPLLICNISASSSVFGGATSADCNMAIASATESVAEVGTAAIGTHLPSRSNRLLVPHSMRQSAHCPRQSGAPSGLFHS
jgi:hypothetical protein